MGVWFTSDSHFGHARVIEYSKRPFADVEEMNETMISRWNEAVRPGDTIYHLGDFFLARQPKVTPEQIAARLQGRKILIRGNHDPKNRHDRYYRLFDEVHDYLEINLQGQHMVLLHYAMRVWNRAHYGSIHLFGHSHGHMPGTSQSLDVGVDCWDYRPVSLEQIKARMATMPPYRANDHHVPRVVPQRQEVEPISPVGVCSDATT